MKPFILQFILAAALSIFFVSCKKNNNAPANTNCQITSIIDSGSSPLWYCPNATYYLKYDSAGRVVYVYANYNADSNKTQKLVLTSVSITYTAGKIIRTFTDMYHSNTSDSISLNSGGYPFTLFFTYSSGSFSYNYFYSQQNMLDSITSSLTAFNTHNYIWQDGDIVKETINNPYSGLRPDSFAFQYYTDRNYQAGDYLNILSLLQQNDGFTYLPYGAKNNHLIKEIIAYDQPGGNSFNYTFDNSGKITAIAVGSGGVNVDKINLEYTCK